MLFAIAFFVKWTCCRVVSQVVWLFSPSFRRKLSPNLCAAKLPINVGDKSNFRIRWRHMEVAVFNWKSIYLVSGWYTVSSSPFSSVCRLCEPLLCTLSLILLPVVLSSFLWTALDFLVFFDSGFRPSNALIFFIKSHEHESQSKYFADRDREKKQQHSRRGGRRRIG